MKKFILLGFLLSAFSCQREQAVNPASNLTDNEDKLHVTFKTANGDQINKNELLSVNSFLLEFSSKEELSYDFLVAHGLQIEKEGMRKTSNLYITTYKVKRNSQNAQITVSYGIDPEVKQFYVSSL